MSDIKKLKTMVEIELLPEIDTFMQKISLVMEGSGKTEEDEEVYAETLELRETFETILEDIAAGEMDEEEASDILKELQKMGKKKSR